jgi:transposase
METVVTVGLDIANNVFQAHGVDAEGGVVFRRRITRAKVRDFFAGPPKCLVGIEACASAHHWAREIGALGHTVKLMPPAYVKPYVRARRTIPPMPRQSARR